MAQEHAVLADEQTKVLSALAPDYALSCHFIPADKRSDVLVLYAFFAEMQSIPLRVTEPLLGEVRLQWWREALTGQRPDQTEINAHPLARQVMSVLHRYHLPAHGLTDLIDAVTDDLYHDPPADLTALELYCGQTHSIMMRYVSLILADGADSGPAGLAGLAGVAYGLTRLLLLMPAQLLNSRRSLIPSSLLNENGVDGTQLHRLKDPVVLRALLQPIVECAAQRYQTYCIECKELPSALRPAFALTGLVPARLRHLTSRLNDPALSFNQAWPDLNPLQQSFYLWKTAVWG